MITVGFSSLFITFFEGSSVYCYQMLLELYLILIGLLSLGTNLISPYLSEIACRDTLKFINTLDPFVVNVQEILVLYSI